jgi:hypothetical protein
MSLSTQTQEPPRIDMEYDDDLKLFTSRLEGTLRQGSISMNGAHTKYALQFDEPLEPPIAAAFSVSTQEDGQWWATAHWKRPDGSVATACGDILVDRDGGGEITNFFFPIDKRKVDTLPDRFVLPIGHTNLYRSHIISASGQTVRDPHLSPITFQARSSPRAPHEADKEEDKKDEGQDGDIGDEADGQGSAYPAWQEALVVL